MVIENLMVIALIYVFSKILVGPYEDEYVYEDEEE